MGPGGTDRSRNMLILAQPTSVFLPVNKSHVPDIAVTSLGARAQQIHNVVMVTKVTEDLQLRHQSFAFLWESSRCLTSTQWVPLQHNHLWNALTMTLDWRFSILTATRVTSSVPRPYAVASTTLPKAPEPKTAPVVKHRIPVRMTAAIKLIGSKHFTET